MFVIEQLENYELLDKTFDNMEDSIEYAKEALIELQCSDKEQITVTQAATNVYTVALLDEDGDELEILSVYETADMKKIEFAVIDDFGDSWETGNIAFSSDDLQECTDWAEDQNYHSSSIVEIHNGKRMWKLPMN